MNYQVLVFLVLCLTACEGLIVSSDIEDSASNNATNNGANNGSNNGSPNNGSPNNGSPNNGSNNTSSNNANNTTATNGTVGPTGSELYVMHCQACHGSEGTGNPAIWPGSIQGFPDHGPIIRMGYGEMAAVVLTDPEIEAIQMYLDDLAPANPTGIERYAQLCGGCHGEAGLGTKRGFGLRFDDRDHLNYWTRTGRDEGQFPFALAGMPAYSTAQVSDSQLEEMWDWLGSFPNETTPVGLYTQYCDACHGPAGLGRSNASGSIVGEGVGPNGVIRLGRNSGNPQMRGAYMGTWNTNQLTNAEVALINSYLNTF